MKVLELGDNFKFLSVIEKRDYLKNILKDNSLKVVINFLIVNNSDIIENFEILNSLSRTKIYKEKNNITNVELISLIINLYVKNNKTKELEKYFKAIDEKKLNIIINYEIEHKTEFSKLKLCTKIYNKLNKSTDKKKKSLETDNSIDNKKKNKSKKTKVSIIFILFMCFLFICYVAVGYCYHKIYFYNNHVYPNIYLDNILISNKTNDEIIKVLNDKNNLLQENIILKNDNETFTYSFESIGYSSNIEKLQKEIVDNYKNINGFQKLYYIFFANKRDFKTEYVLDDTKYTEFIDELRSKVNVSKTNEYFKISNGSIIYQKGINGFTLDDSSLISDIESSLQTGIREINLKGNIETTSNTLGLKNKKVSSFTTYYNESQGRARNIRNAVSKLNGKILYPGEIFSFYKTVGPYNGAHGYIFYAKDVGSGVCQVSTTVYNAAILLNLPIISRENHGDMVYYVDYGMDATVYGSSVDMKFKNSSSYPIYIEASANSGTLTVNMWSNENIIGAGYSYKPRVEQISSLGFKTYLDTYYNGEYKSTKYLNSSYYMKGK